MRKKKRLLGFHSSVLPPEAAGEKPGNSADAEGKGQSPEAKAPAQKGDASGAEGRRPTRASSIPNLSAGRGRAEPKEEKANRVARHFIPQTGNNIPVTHGTRKRRVECLWQPDFARLLTAEDREVLRDSVDEEGRPGAGHFQRVFPTAHTEHRYAHLFEQPRFYNVLLCRWAQVWGRWWGVRQGTFIRN